MLKKKRKRNPKEWKGSLPETCDICQKHLCRGRDRVWVDGKTIMGPWANMCLKCFKEIGVGLGIGRGQMYDCESGQQVNAKVIARFL